jgi:hypothetical protein
MGYALLMDDTLTAERTTAGPSGTVSDPAPTAVSARSAIPCGDRLVGGREAVAADYGPELGRPRLR